MFVLCLLVAQVVETAVMEHQICNSSAHIIPLEMGDSGIVAGAFDIQTYHHQESCKLQLLSCDSCHINLQFAHLEFPDCQANTSQLPHYLTCIEGCSHLTLLEPAYADVTTHYYFGSNHSTTYTSLSSSVVVTLCLAAFQGRIMQPGNFSLHYEIIEKRRVYNGHSWSPINWGTIQSPNFPLGYAVQGEIYEYLLENLDPGGHVRISFEDWDLSPSSRICFYENTTSATPLAVHVGSTYRPVIESQGSTLYVTFHPDVGITSRTHNMGFKATYTFVNGSHWMDKPKTDCGKYFKYQSGGSFTVPGQMGSNEGYIDCIWVITKNSAFDWVYLRFQTSPLPEGWQNMTLTVRSGLVSDSPIIANYDGTINMTITNQTELESRHGFYMRLHGNLTFTDHISLVFMAFNRPIIGGCPHSGEFYCKTSNHCIEQHLVCDGRIHCPYASDEDTFCQTTTTLATVFPVRLCKSHEFACKNGRRCVPKSALCDNWLDCSDGSDEYVCASPTVQGYTKGVTIAECQPGLKLCHSHDQCIFDWQICNGKYNCWDRSDESDCSSSVQTTMSVDTPWSIIIPMGIALCVVFFICALAMCLRNHYKNYHQYHAHPMRRPSGGVRRSQYHILIFP